MLGIFGRDAVFRALGFAAGADSGNQADAAPRPAIGVDLGVRQGAAGRAEGEAGGA